MKRISAKKAASDEMPKDLEIEAGTTAYDVLRALNLSPAQHSVGLPDGTILRGNDSLYTRVNDGDKVLLTEQATVGEFKRIRVIGPEGGRTDVTLEPLATAADLFSALHLEPDAYCVGLRDSSVLSGRDPLYLMVADGDLVWICQQPRGGNDAHQA